MGFFSKLLGGKDKERKKEKSERKGHKDSSDAAAAGPTSSLSSSSPPSSSSAAASSTAATTARERAGNVYLDPVNSDSVAAAAATSSPARRPAQAPQLNFEIEEVSIGEITQLFNVFYQILSAVQDPHVKALSVKQTKAMCVRLVEPKTAVTAEDIREGFSPAYCVQPLLEAVLAEPAPLRARHSLALYRFCVTLENALEEEATQCTTGFLSVLRNANSNLGGGGEEGADARGPQVTAAAMQAASVGRCEDLDLVKIYKNLLRGVNYLPTGAEMHEILLRIASLLRGLPNVVPALTPLVVVGDIHGQIKDILNHVITAGGPLVPAEVLRAQSRRNKQKKNKSGGKRVKPHDTTTATTAAPPFNNYLFLGDYVDRGRRGLQCMCLLFVAKLLSPDAVTLLRGNHESRLTNMQYGFLAECCAAYPMKKGKLTTSATIVAAILSDDDDDDEDDHDDYDADSAAASAASCAARRRKAGSPAIPISSTGSKSKSKSCGSSISSSRSAPVGVGGKSVTSPAGSKSDGGSGSGGGYEQQPQVDEEDDSIIDCSDWGAPDHPIWLAANDAFECLPLCAAICEVDDGAVAVQKQKEETAKADGTETPPPLPCRRSLILRAAAMHGGLSPYIENSFDGIIAINRFDEVQFGALADLTWSDPIVNAPSPSTATMTTTTTSTAPMAMIPLAASPSGSPLSDRHNNDPSPIASPLQTPATHAGRGSLLSSSGITPAAPQSNNRGGNSNGSPSASASASTPSLSFAVNAASGRTHVVTTDDFDFSQPISYTGPPIGYRFSSRGTGHNFGEDVTAKFLNTNGLRFIVRAHQCVHEGFQWVHQHRLLTVFSAPNYCGMGNKGAVLLLDKQCSPSLVQYEYDAEFDTADEEEDGAGTRAADAAPFSGGGGAGAGGFVPPVPPREFM